jgi:ABC-type sugar transport system substrate-binding protein
MKLKWLILIFLFHGVSNASSLQVSFIVPDKEANLFWQQVIDVAQSVADDLDIKLTVHFSDTNRFSSLDTVDAVSQDKIKPDYLIYRPLQGNAVSVLDLLESRDIPFVTLERGFSDAEAIEIGKPQQKYKYWLGAVTYDDKAAGALLTSALYKQHLKNNPLKKMYVTGISGAFDRVSMARQSSLEKLYRSSGNIVINQVFPMSWELKNVEENFPAIYRRYPDTNAYWCVADSFCLTVIKQLKKLGSASAKKIVLGGFDWLPPAIDKIKTGEMTASVGGHFLMVSKALLNIVEYHNANNVFLTNTKLERYELIDKNNVDEYQPFLNKAPWSEVDYRQFSSVYNKQKKPIELSIANLMLAHSRLNKSN